MARKCRTLHKAAWGATLVTQAPRCAECMPSKAGGHYGLTAGDCREKPTTSGAQGCFVLHRWSLPIREGFFLPALNYSLPILPPFIVMLAGSYGHSVMWPIGVLWAWFEPFICGLSLDLGVLGRGQKDLIGKMNSFNCHSFHSPLF